MSRKAYHIPDMSNATPSGLVDMLADAREKEAEAKFYAGFYKDALKARWPKELIGKPLEGEKFCAELKVVEATRFDINAARAAAEKDPLLAAYLMKFMVSSEQERLETKERAKVNKAFTGVK
jgi:hypothetical protein